MLKNFVFTLFFVVFGQILIFSQDIWLRQQTPTVLWLNRCSFPDSLNGWAAGEDGIILRTSNGGTNWSIQNSPVDFFIYDIFFLNKRLGWALANDNFPNRTAVLSTTNGGDNWNFYRFPDSTTLLLAVHFSDSLNGFLGGYFGKIYRTTNSGASWQQVFVDSSFSSYQPIYRIASKNNIVAASGGIFDILGVMWTSTNSGLNWISRGITSEPMFCFTILSPSKIVALGGDFEFGALQAKTYNSGVNWSYDYLNTFGIPKGLSFRTQSEAWAVLSISARFLYSLDTGNTWNTYDVPDTLLLYDIIFTDQFHGYAVGTKGGIFKYNPETIGIINNSNNLPNSNRLYQNYPNPFNPNTSFKYKISDRSTVRITIYDVTGRIINVLFEGEKPAGTYEIRFNASGLSSGIYFYKLETSDYFETKKMVVLK